MSRASHPARLCRRKARQAAWVHGSCKSLTFNMIEMHGAITMELPFIPARVADFAVSAFPVE
jgi:hypothetical protein